MCELPWDAGHRRSELFTSYGFMRCFGVLPVEPRRRLLRPLSGLGLAIALLGMGCVHRPRDTGGLFDDFTVQAHRGGAELAPENTMAAFDRAVALGVGFELDVVLTADGVPVVFHDDELDRLTDAEGPVAGRDLEALRGLDAGIHFDRSFSGERIPTLDEVLARHGHQVVINIEVKSSKGADNEALARAVVDAVHRHGLQERVLITSFSPFLLEAIREQDPELRRGQIYSRFEGTSSLKWIEKVLLRNLAFNRRALPDVLSVDESMVDARYLRKMHRRGYRVFAWTVDDPARMRELIDLGVDGLITDRPDLLLEVRGDVDPPPLARRAPGSPD